MAAPPLIREARVDDVPALAALVQAAYRGPGGWTNEIGLVEGRRIGVGDLRRLVADPSGAFLVATDAIDGTIVGCCHISAGGDEGEVAGLGLVAVAPERQAAGIGRRLVDAARHRAVDRFAAAALEITVVSGQPGLVAWYERLGFRATGATRPFHDGDPDDRPLVPGLHFVVMRAALRGQP